MQKPIIIIMIALALLLLLVGTANAVTPIPNGDFDNSSLSPFIRFPLSTFYSTYGQYDVPISGNALYVINNDSYNGDYSIISDYYYQNGPHYYGYGFYVDNIDLTGVVNISMAIKSTASNIHASFAVIVCANGAFTSTTQYTALGSTENYTTDTTYQRVQVQITGQTGLHRICIVPMLALSSGNAHIITKYDDLRLNMISNTVIPTINYYVNGTVKDINNNPLRYARVILWNNGTYVTEGTSGVNGDFTMILPNGNRYAYGLTTTFPNYYPIISSNGSVIPTDTMYYVSNGNYPGYYQTIDYVMNPSEIYKNFYATDYNNNTVLKNVVYYITDTDLSYTFTVTNTNSSITVYLTQNHNYSVTATVNGYINMTKTFFTNNLNDVGFALTLSTAGNYEITGQVLSNTGYPQTLAKVYMYYPNGSLCSVSSISGVGQYYVYSGTNAPTGTYTLIAQDLTGYYNNTTLYITNPNDFNAYGYWNYQAQIYVISGYNFYMPVAGSGQPTVNNTQVISVYVVDNNQRFIDGYLTIRGNYGNTPGSFFTCAHTGNGVNFNLPYDSYQVTASAVGYESSTQLIQLPNLNSNFRIVLYPNTSINPSNPTGTPKPYVKGHYVIFAYVTSISNGISNANLDARLSVLDVNGNSVYDNTAKTNTKGVVSWDFTDYTPSNMYMVSVSGDYVRYNVFDNPDSYFFTDDASNDWQYSATYDYYYHIFNLKVESGTYYLIGSVKDINGNVIVNSNIQCWDSKNDLLYSVISSDGYNGVYKIPFYSDTNTGLATLFAGAEGYTNTTFSFSYPFDFKDAYTEETTGTKQHALFKDMILNTGDSTITYYYVTVYDTSNNYNIISDANIVFTSLETGQSYNVITNFPFTMTYLPKERFNVYITKEGYSDYSTSLDLTNYQKTTISFYMSATATNPTLSPTVTPIPIDTTGNINGDLSNMLRFFYNQWGINEPYAQQFTTAILIIFILAAICGGIGIATGNTGFAGILSTVGGLVGVLIVCTTGFLPFWFLFVLVLEVIAYLLYFNNTGGDEYVNE